MTFLGVGSSAFREQSRIRLNSINSNNNQTEKVGPVEKATEGLDTVESSQSMRGINISHCSFVSLDSHRSFGGFLKLPA